MMTKNLGLEVKSKTKMEKSNLVKVERRAVIRSLILMMMNVVHIFAPTRMTFYLVLDVCGFSVPALNGSTKTVWRIVK